MRKLIILAAIVGTLATAGVAAAAPGGAEVFSQNSCESAWFGTVCTTLHATTNMTATPSGNVIYVTNGTLTRELTFSFGGTFTATSDVHLTAFQKQGELHVISERSTQSTSSRSGTYALDCSGSIRSHYANGSMQYAEYTYDCTTP